MLAYFILFITALSLALTQNAPVVPVQTFTPEPIQITVNDLPPPYNTSSAGKGAIVVPIPSDATLLVPDANFRVTIYRSGLSSPRQMIYTPTGDILVTGAGGNRISILSGDDTAIFADASNGISQAFGIAFVQVSFISFINFFSKMSLFRVIFILIMQVIFVDILIKVVIKDYEVLDKFL